MCFTTYLDIVSLNVFADGGASALVINSPVSVTIIVCLLLHSPLPLEQALVVFWNLIDFLVVTTLVRTTPSYVKELINRNMLFTLLRYQHRIS